MIDEGAAVPSDPYARAEYRRLIAWKRRIAREGPWLEALLAEAPELSVLDLGCGSGEHAAFFAARGARVVGVDASPSMIEDARTHEHEGGPRFVLGDVRVVDALLASEPPFGLALALGNVLPHLAGDADLDRFLDAVRACLLPGGLLLLQLLDYERIRAQGTRHLPLDVREEATGRWIVFLRLLEILDEERILFLPTTLEVDPEAEEPVAVKRSRRVVLRTWTAETVRERLEVRGFGVRLHGDMQGGAHQPGLSHDLVVVARRGVGGQAG